MEGSDDGPLIEEAARGDEGLEAFVVGTLLLLLLLVGAVVWDEW